MLENDIFAGILKVNDQNMKIRIQYPDPDMDSLFRGMDPGIRIRIRIRIHHKMSWIRNIAQNYHATSSSSF